MKKLNHFEINNLITKLLTSDNQEDDLNNLEQELKKSIYKKAVLGIDIYRYSQYKLLPQILIPHLFKILYDLTVKNCLKHEPTMFKEFNLKRFREHFIDTGDGGFQIFENPFHAIIFSIYFQSNVARYNSNGITTAKLNSIIGDITLRYTLTYDDVYSYENNHFGAGIINCARIISRDKLNRFLIDENTKKWFVEKLNNVENLAYLELWKEYKFFDFIKVSEGEKFESLIFSDTGNKIKNVDIMKIGEIKSKLDTLSIYNLHIQSLMFLTEASKFKKITITLGNLNSNGLHD